MSKGDGCGWTSMKAYTSSFRSESASVMRMSRTELDPCVSGISKKKSV